MNVINIFKKLSINQIFWLVLLCILICVFTLIVAFNFNFLVNHISDVITIISTSVAIFLWFEKKSLAFAKIVAKAKATLLNKQVAISLNADYEGEEINEDTFEQIKIKLQEIGKKYEIIENNKTSFRIRVSGLNIDAKLYFKDNESLCGENDFIGHINIYLPEYHAPYNESIKLLQSKLLTILTDIEDTSKPLIHNYKVEIIFTNNENPYLSVYTKKLGANLIDFNCEIAENTDAETKKIKHLISVTKEQMKFSANNILSLSNLITDHLAL